MIFVIVKDKTSNIVGKETYGGDDTESNAIIDKLKQANPSFTYTLVSKEEFSLAIIAPTVTKDQTDWQTEKSKGTAPAIDYLARKLGLQ